MSKQPDNLDKFAKTIGFERVNKDSAERIQFYIEVDGNGQSTLSLKKMEQIYSHLQKLFDELEEGLPEKKDLTFMTDWQDGQNKSYFNSAIDQIKQSIHKLRKEYIDG